MKGSPSLYPEENDMIILAEVVELSKTTPISLISGDKHFSYFKFEIEEKYGLDVLDFRDLSQSV